MNNEKKQNRIVCPYLMQLHSFFSPLSIHLKLSILYSFFIHFLFFCFIATTARLYLSKIFVGKKNRKLCKSFSRLLFAKQYNHPIYSFLLEWIHSDAVSYFFHHKSLAGAPDILSFPVRLAPLEMFSLYNNLYFPRLQHNRLSFLWQRMRGYIKKRITEKTSEKVKSEQKEMDMVIGSASKCHNWKRRQTQQREKNNRNKKNYK